MEVLWNSLARPDWDRAAAAGHAALPQDWAYGEAMAAIGAPVMRAHVLDDGALIAIAQFTWRRFAGVLTWALCTRGPVWTKPLCGHQKAAVYRALRKSADLGRLRVMMFTPEEEAADALARARLNRVMTGYSTAFLDLTQSEDALLAAMRGKWRGRMRAAQRSALSVRRAGAKPAQYRWILEKESTQRRDRRYRALPLDFVGAFQEAGGERDRVRIWRADVGRQTVAAMVFLTHATSATYHIGWNDAANGVPGAHNLILWSAIRALKEDGFTRLDMGGLNTTHGAGIARFKLGSGARPMTLCGAYL